MAKMPCTLQQQQPSSCTVTTTAAATAAQVAESGVSVSSRIPATLQSVFLASNRGQTVHKPPPAKVASKTYFRNWFFQGAGRSNSNNSNGKSTSNKTSGGGPRRGSLFSFKGGFNTTSTMTSTSPLPSGMCSPRTATSLNGSKYKMVGSVGVGAAAVCSSKKETDALVHAAIAAAERLEQQAQYQQSFDDKKPSATTTTTTPTSTTSILSREVATSVTEGESESSSSSSTDVSVAANETTTTTTSLQTESPSETVSPTPPPPQPKAIVISPQDYLDNLLSARGYCTRRFPTLQTAYYNKPTALQMASYHVHLINLARREECHNFAALLSSGLSSNPANSHGESLLHTICRRGWPTVLKVMLETCHSIVAVADDYGRTPLHDAMWNNTPSLATISLLLKHGDASALFFLQDTRGALPLQYARQEHWPVWLEYLKHVQDDFWPVRNVATAAQDGSIIKEPSTLLTSPPGSHPLPDPIHALPLQVAVLVASGKLSPAEAVFLVDEDDSDDENGNDDDDMSGSDEDNANDDDDDDDDDSDDDSSCSSWDEEMDDMLQELAATSKKA